MISLHTFAQFFDPVKVLDVGNLKITYTISWKEDTTNPNHLRKEDMILIVGKTVSLFMSDNFYKLNVHGRKAEKEGQLDQFLGKSEMEKFRTRFTYRIIKNLPEGKYTYFDKVIPNYLQYTEDFGVIKWQLANEVDTIGKYAVHCAKSYYGGRLWVAWYTTEIPINDGPYKFRGLPGLILKLYDEKKHYVFQLSRIERFENGLSIDYEDRIWTQISRAGFLKAQDNLKFDIINKAKDAGLNNVSQMAAFKAMSKKNNPIEF